MQHLILTILKWILVQLAEYSSLIDNRICFFCGSKPPIVVSCCKNSDTAIARENSRRHLCAL